MARQQAASAPVSPDAGVLLLTVQQVAAALQIDRNRAYELVATRKIPHVRIGRSIRVPKSALLQWIDNMTAGADTPR